MITRSMTLSIGSVWLVMVVCTLAWCSESDRIMAPDAQVAKLADGFQFTEGPACDSKGNVYFTDIPNERIHIWSTEGKLSTFREKSGGANGLYFDAKGNLFACEGGNRQVTRISPDGKVEVLVDRYDGKKLNSPNDLWVTPDGGVYFTDPRYGQDAQIEQDGFHVYYLPSGGKKPVRVLDNLVKPNGIVGTADGRHLYVTDAGAGKTYVYRVQPDGTLVDRKLVVAIGADGMTLDAQGNLYLARGAVHVVNPAGKEIATIQVPESPSNVCFGGADRKTLFITARKGLYAVKMNVRGQ